MRLVTSAGDVAVLTVPRGAAVGARTRGAVRRDRRRSLCPGRVEGDLDTARFCHDRRLDRRFGRSCRQHDRRRRSRPGARPGTVHRTRLAGVGRPRAQALDQHLPRRARRAAGRSGGRGAARFVARDRRIERRHEHVDGDTVGDRGDGERVRRGRRRHHEWMADQVVRGDDLDPAARAHDVHDTVLLHRIESAVTPTIEWVARAAVDGQTDRRHVDTRARVADLDADHAAELRRVADRAPRRSGRVDGDGEAASGAVHPVADRIARCHGEALRAHQRRCGSCHGGAVPQTRRPGHGHRAIEPSADRRAVRIAAHVRCDVARQRALELRDHRHRTSRVGAEARGSGHEGHGRAVSVHAGTAGEAVAWRAVDRCGHQLQAIERDVVPVHLWRLASEVAARFAFRLAGGRESSSTLDPSSAMSITPASSGTPFHPLLTTRTSPVTVS